MSKKNMVWVISTKQHTVENRFGRFEFIPGIPLKVSEDYRELLVKANPEVYKKFESKVGDKRATKLMAILEDVKVAREKIVSLEADKKKMEKELQQLIIEANTEMHRVEQSYVEDGQQVDSTLVKSPDDVLGPPQTLETLQPKTGAEDKGGYTPNALNKMKKDELLEIAEELNIELGGEETNSQIAERILATQ
jgi:hypothetical protein